MYIIISITNESMLSLGDACVTSTSFQTIDVIRSETNKYIPFAHNSENYNVKIIQYNTCIYIMHNSDIVYKAADVNL